MEESSGGFHSGPWAGELRWHLTDEGWDHYRMHWADYRRLYSEVDALDPHLPVEDQVRELLSDRDRERDAVEKACPAEVRRAVDRAQRASEEAGHHLARLEAALTPLQEALADAVSGGALEAAPPGLPPDLASQLQEPSQRYLRELRRWRAAVAARYAELSARLVDAVAAAPIPPRCCSRRPAAAGPVGRGSAGSEWPSSMRRSPPRVGSPPAAVATSSTPTPRPWPSR